jgi:hypothetical protein
LRGDNLWDLEVMEALLSAKRTMQRRYTVKEKGRADFSIFILSLRKF